MSQKKILIATHNEGKLDEIKKLFSGLDYKLVSLDDIGITHDVEETGNTFQENAILKAKTYAQMSGLVTIADDGGLKVEALGGQPGVYSSRYAGPNKTDAQKVTFLLDKLKNIPEDKRYAQFVVVLALAQPDGAVKLYKGVMPGHIALTARGTPRKQLPYRQIFIPEGFDKTLDELDDQDTRYLSHRQKAFKQLLKDILQLKEF